MGVLDELGDELKQAIMLTTTGAKSGSARTMPLVGIPLGDDLAVIGSNYGQKPTPGWVYNPVPSA